MQRRAAAIYFVFFLVVGAGAWAYIGYAEDTQRPQFSVSGPTFESETNQTIGGTEYTVTGITGSADEPEASVAWTNDSYRHTGTIENDTIYTLDDTNYSVVIANRTNVSSATFREYFNVSARLAADDAVENELATQNDTEYVVYRENRSLVPLDEYLPERDVVEFEVNDTIPYEGNETTISAIEPAGITVEWIAPGEETNDLQPGSNMTLVNGDRYFAHFQSNESVTLVPGDQYEQYAATVADREYFQERLAGLWGVVILAGVAAIFLLGAAYMPVRG